MKRLVSIFTAVLLVSFFVYFLPDSAVSGEDITLGESLYVQAWKRGISTHLKILQVKSGI